MNWMFILVPLLIILIMQIPIKIRVLNIKDETDILFIFGKIIKFHLDYEKVVRIFYTSKYNRDKISISEIYENIRKVVYSRNILVDFFKYSKLHKIVFISDINIVDGYYSPFIYTYNWVVLSYIQGFTRGLFKSIENEYYGVCENYDGNNLDIDFDLIIGFNFSIVIIVMLKNLREIPSLYKRLS